MSENLLINVQQLHDTTNVLSDLTSRLQGNGATASGQVSEKRLAGEAYAFLAKIVETGAMRAISAIVDGTGQVTDAVGSYASTIANTVQQADESLASAAATDLVTTPVDTWTSGAVGGIDLGAGLVSSIDAAIAPGINEVTQFLAPGSVGGITEPGRLANQVVADGFDVAAMVGAIAGGVDGVGVDGVGGVDGRQGDDGEAGADGLLLGGVGGAAVSAVAALRTAAGEAAGTPGVLGVADLDHVLDAVAKNPAAVVAGAAMAGGAGLLGVMAMQDQEEDDQDDDERDARIRARARAAAGIAGAAGAAGGAGGVAGTGGTGGTVDPLTWTGDAVGASTAVAREAGNLTTDAVDALAAGSRDPAAVVAGAAVAGGAGMLAVVAMQDQEEDDEDEDQRDARRRRARAAS